MVKLYQYGIGVGVGLYAITVAIGAYGELIGRQPNELVVGVLGLVTLVLLVPSTAWGALEVLRARKEGVERRPKVVRETDRLETAPGPTPRPTEQPEGLSEETSQTLRDLRTLFEQGLLTEEEYERKRETLLRTAGDDLQVPTQ